MSNFARIERLDLVFYLPTSHFYTTKHVIQEVENGVDDYPKLQNVLHEVNSRIEVISLEEKSTLDFMSKLKSGSGLGTGEISTIALTKECNGIFITDDKVATNYAERHNVEVIDSNNHKDTFLILNYLLESNFVSKKDLQRIKENLKSIGFV